MSYSLGGYCIDDASTFSVARALVDMHCPNGRKFKKDLNDIITQFLSLGREVPFVSALWLLSKFRSEKELLEKVIANEPLWVENEWVGRQVGSICARFIGNKLFPPYLEIIRQSRNAGAQATFSLHHKLSKEANQHQSTFSYLKALSPSQPRRFVFPKILLLRSFLLSPSPPSSKAALRIVYRALPLDHYEKRCLRGLL
jgi:hypothetical protein